MDEKKKKEEQLAQTVDPVAQAQEKLKSQLAQKPGAYQSAWQSSLDDTMNRIMNREKFSYDLNGDALWKQYKDQYTQAGKMAMMDTMGQAAQLTGGYGNTYGQRVGQQAYNSHLQSLNDKVPELYQLALGMYNQEGDRMMNQLALLQDQENQAYNRHKDQMAQWQSGYDRAYGEYMDQVQQQYQQGRDQVADQKWQAEFDEAKRRYDQEWAAAHPETSGSGSQYYGGSDASEDGKLDISNALAQLGGAGSKDAALALADALIAQGYDADAIYSYIYNTYDKLPKKTEQTKPGIQKTKAMV